MYFQPIFLNLIKNIGEEYETNLIILSKKLKPFVKCYESNFEFYFFDVDKISSLNFFYIIRCILDFNKLRTYRLLNLNFWSKYNWCDFPMRIISSTNRISFDCYYDLYPKYFLQSKFENNHIKYYFKDDKSKSLEKYSLPLINLLEYQSLKLKEIFPKLEKINFSNLISCQKVEKSNNRTIALFPFASTLSKSLNPILLKNLLSLLDSYGFEILVFGSKADSLKFKKIESMSLSNRVKLLYGKVALNNIYEVLNKCSLILTVDSFVSHLMLSNKFSPPLLIVNIKNNFSDIQKFFIIKHSLVNYVEIDNKFGFSCKKDIDTIVNSFFSRLNY
ncbi:MULTISPECIES: glycosyltransferase family 9 protein [Prochlorococcus]|nr:glycosyltransferase family 9 protein [Prochlorococcus marinus]